MTAYEMRISDWSSDVGSSDLDGAGIFDVAAARQDDAEALALDRAVHFIGDERAVILARLPFIGIHRDAVGIGAPGAADRPAVGHAAPAAQAYAIVAFARDR